MDKATMWLVGLIILGISLRMFYNWKDGKNEGYAAGRKEAKYWIDHGHDPEAMLKDVDPKFDNDPEYERGWIDYAKEVIAEDAKNEKV